MAFSHWLTERVWDPNSLPSWKSTAVWFIDSYSRAPHALLGFFSFPFLPPHSCLWESDLRQPAQPPHHVSTLVPWEVKATVATAEVKPHSVCHSGHRPMASGPPAISGQGQGGNYRKKQAKQMATWCSEARRLGNNAKILRNGFKLTPLRICHVTLNGTPSDKIKPSCFPRSSLCRAFVSFKESVPQPRFCSQLLVRIKALQHCSLRCLWGGVNVSV